MAFAKARTALAQLEEKLRRQLGLAGEVGATFLPELTPVIIAADLREAGNASNTGRGWMLAIQPGGAGAVFSLRVEADVFVDRLYLGQVAGAAARHDVWLTVPGQAPAAAVLGALSGQWVDRKLVQGDQVPITVATAWLALTGTNVNDQNRIAAAALTTSGNIEFDLNMMLPAGSCLNFAGSAGNTLITLRGRIWP